LDVEGYWKVLFQSLGFVFLVAVVRYFINWALIHHVYYAIVLNMIDIL
jgi:hypothetical protein